MADVTKVKITAGRDIGFTDLLSFVIDRDMFQPDMAAIVISNQGSLYSDIEIGAPVEVGVRDGATPIFKGEVVGLEASYKGGEKKQLTIRAMNKMHRLLRKRKSITYTDKTDQQILSQVVQDAGLSLEWKHDAPISYKHVYQHNQTDMEFLRMRAARMGCHVWCWDKQIFVKQPELQGGPIATLGIGPEGDQQLRTFTPRLSSAAILKKVTVKGWNPETKELITGDYSAQSSQLGKENAVAGSAKFNPDETFTVDHPIWSKEEAKALAKARLVDLSLSYITGEAMIEGTPDYDLGKLVQILPNQEDGTKAKDPFNGKYYIMGVSHRYSERRGKDGGYLTTLRVARDAQKG